MPLLFIPVIIWLGMLSWFDIRRREIPHPTWVAIPLAAAGFYRGCSDGAGLVFLAAVVVLISERERIAQVLHKTILKGIPAWLPLLLPAFLFAGQASAITAAAITGFWIGWELKIWGGADAVSAIILALIWPGATFILAFLAVHTIVSLVLLIRDKAFLKHRLPGLPVLLLSVILMISINLLHPF